MISKDYWFGWILPTSTLVCLPGITSSGSTRPEKILTQLLKQMDPFFAQLFCRSVSLQRWTGRIILLSACQYPIRCAPRYIDLFRASTMFFCRSMFSFIDICTGDLRQVRCTALEIVAGVSCPAVRQCRIVNVTQPELRCSHSLLGLHITLDNHNCFVCNSIIEREEISSMHPQAIYT